MVKFLFCSNLVKLLVAPKYNQSSIIFSFWYNYLTKQERERIKKKDSLLTKCSVLLYFSSEMSTIKK